MAGKKRKGFFALDVDQFERAVDLGLEPAAAYLALMAGTDQSNTVSAWGANAIATHNGIIMLTFTPLDGMSDVVMSFLPAEMHPSDPE